MNNNPVYMCKDCLDNKETKRKIFYTLNKPNPEEYKNQCLTCGSNHVYKINLSNDETERLINLLCDINTILEMNELKIKDYDSFISKFNHFEEIQREEDIARQKWEKERERQGRTYPKTNVPKCPTCGSTKVHKISGMKRWVSTGIFGLASSDLGKSMQCDNCGYKW